MHRLSLPLSTAVFFLLLSAAAGPLQAQIQIGPDGPHPLPTPAAAATFYIGSYTGTVTQTSPAGQVSTGTSTLSLPTAAAADPDGIKRIDSGRLTASITLGGVTTNYVGRLARNSHGVRSVPGVAYLRAVAADGAAPLFAPAKIPVVINVDLAYGGFQDGTGTSLTFRGAREAFVLSTGGEVQPR